MFKSVLILLLIVFTLLSFTIKTDIPYTFKVISVKDNLHENENKIHIYATLLNNTNDTLKFLTMSCMWSIIYSTNNSNVEMAGPWACDGNFPVLITVPPFKSYQAAFYVVVKPNSLKQKFKIAIHLHKVKSEFEFHGLDFFSGDNYKPQVIWSNETL